MSGLSGLAARLPLRACDQPERQSQAQLPGGDEAEAPGVGMVAADRSTDAYPGSSSSRRNFSARPSNSGYTPGPYAWRIAGLHISHR